MEGGGANRGVYEGRGCGGGRKSIARELSKARRLKRL
jgi:hypothetical protein